MQLVQRRPRPNPKAEASLVLGALCLGAGPPAPDVWTALRSRGLAACYLLVWRARWAASTPCTIWSHPAVGGKRSWPFGGPVMSRDPLCTRLFQERLSRGPSFKSVFQEALSRGPSFKSAAVSAFPEDLAFFENPGLDDVDQVVPVDGDAQRACQRRHAVRVEVLFEVGGCERAAEHCRLRGADGLA